MAVPHHFSGKGLDAATAGHLARAAQRVHLAAGHSVFAPGQPCDNYLLVIAGSVRVSTMTENGRELVLYRVGPGEACVLTTACLMAGKDYDAFGAAETDVEAYALPRATFETLLDSSAGFRRFVFDEFGGRLTAVIAVVQEVAERHVDRRLARFLLDRASSGEIRMTHQAIAAELGTAREVVSRLLKELSGRGFVEIGRGYVMVVDAGALDRLQSGP
jgi:CRP/FNR family transcriptional regulator, anaerobic regulatory protein